MADQDITEMEKGIDNRNVLILTNRTNTQVLRLASRHKHIPSMRFLAGGFAGSRTSGTRGCHKSPIIPNFSLSLTIKTNT
jgi:hypothetical protein